MQLLGIVVGIEFLGILLAGGNFLAHRALSTSDMRYTQLAQIDSAIPPSIDATPPPPPPDGSASPDSSSHAPADASQDPSTPDAPIPPESESLPDASPPPATPDAGVPEAPPPETPPGEGSSPLPPDNSIPVDNSAQPPVESPENNGEADHSASGEPSDAGTQRDTETPGPDQKSTAGLTEAAPPVSQDIIAPIEAIADVSHIDTEIITKTAVEETQLAQAETPEAKTNLLINFANESVDDVNTALERNSFAGVNFLTQRLIDQIDQATNFISQAPPEEQAVFREKMQTFSQQADQGLRNQQLVVPEELEQDMEIARGKLLLLRQ